MHDRMGKKRHESFDKNSGELKTVIRNYDYPHQICYFKILSLRRHQKNTVNKVQ